MTDEKIAGNQEVTGQVVVYRPYFVFYLLLFPKDGLWWNTDPGRDILQKIGTEKEHFLQDDPVQASVLCREWAVCWGYANIIA